MAADGPTDPGMTENSGGPPDMAAHPALSGQEALAALSWLVEMGADEAIADAPIDRFAATKAALDARAAQTPQTNRGPVNRQTISRPSPTPQQQRPSAVLGTTGSPQEAEAAAKQATTLEDLSTALKDFDGGTLKRGAKTCVFADGQANPDLMVIGEAPGADEDRAGLPFVGPAGQLLDKMLAAIGCSRSSNSRIANVIPWRPLGNRTPDKEMVGLYLPFLMRHIELAKPKLILAVGKVPTSALSGKDDAMSRMRGKAIELTCGSHHTAMIPTYHPAYLLRTPEAKAQVWKDLLMVKAQLKDLGCDLS